MHPGVHSGRPDPRLSLLSTPHHEVLGVIPARPAYLYADVLDETGVSESYLAFLIRQGLIRPVKARNGRTNLFASAELDRIRWALGHRGQMTVAEMRAALEAQIESEQSPKSLQACG